MAVYYGAYSGQDIDRLLAKADSSDVFSELRLNGLSFEKISRTDYEDLEEKDPDTVYFVYDEKGRIKEYMGVTELSGGKLTGGSIITGLQNDMSMVTGIIEED